MGADFQAFLSQQFGQPQFQGPQGFGQPGAGGIPQFQGQRPGARETQNFISQNLQQPANGFSLAGGFGQPGGAQPGSPQGLVNQFSQFATQAGLPSRLNTSPGGPGAASAVAGQLAGQVGGGPGAASTVAGLLSQPSFAGGKPEQGGFSPNQQFGGNAFANNPDPRFAQFGQSGGGSFDKFGGGGFGGGGFGGPLGQNFQSSFPGVQNQSFGFGGPFGSFGFGASPAFGGSPFGGGFGGGGFNGGGGGKGGSSFLK